MRAISAAVEVRVAIGAIARRAIAMPAISASTLPASTPTSRNSSTRLTVASVGATGRAYCTITWPTGRPVEVSRTGAGWLITR